MKSVQNAFTLAEVLIALALLGVVAAFTIPKVLHSTGSQQRLTATRQAEAMLAGAFEMIRQENGGSVPPSVSFADLMAKVNVLSRDTTTMIDHFPNVLYGNWANCANTVIANCYRLPTGGMFYVNKDTQFGKTLAAPTPNTNRGMLIIFDPDGARNNQPSIGFVLYRTGKLLTAAGTLPNTGFESATSGSMEEVGIPAGSSLNPDGSCPSMCDPTWFKR